MSVLAMVTVTQWVEARLAATPIDDRPWLAHLVARLGQAPAVSRVVVAGHPDCLAMLAPHVPAGIELVGTAAPLAWAATVPGADLVAPVPVWQLFADPARLEALAAAPRSVLTARVAAVDEHDPAIDLSGGAYVELLTRRGCALAAAGIAPSAAECVSVPCAPEPPELRLAPRGDAGWGVTLQRALLAAGSPHGLADVSEVLTAAGLRRFAFWRDGVGPGPRRVLTIRCLPAAAFARLLAHLRRLPGAAVDVLCPEPLAAATAALAGVSRVITFPGPSFDLGRLPAATHAALRAAGYDLCVVPRRTPCGRGFENVTPLGVASGAAVAVWMDLTGASGQLAGLARGWEPWVTEAPPWHDVTALGERAAAAWRMLAPERPDVAAAPHDPEVAARETAAAIIARLDEHVSCHALLDNPDAGLELAPLLLHQLPAVTAAHGAVARLRADARPVAAQIGHLVDRVLEHGVMLLAEIGPGADDEGRADLTRRAADALGRLTERIAAAGAGSDDEAAALAQGESLARALTAAAAAALTRADRPEGRA